MSNTDRSERSRTQQHNARTLSGFYTRNPCQKIEETLPTSAN